MKRIALAVFIHLTVPVALFSQAGSSVFQFLNLPVSSRLAALGGTNVSLRDDDLNFAFQNPALLTENTHNNISLNYALYLADIMFGSAAYSYNYGKNYFAAGIHYIDYGKFDYADEVGELSGEQFTAKDFAMNLMYARQLNDYFTAGATLKPIYSVYERYTSFAMALDMGVHFQSKNKLFMAGLVFRNMGVQLKGYYDTAEGQHREKLPFDIQLGISQKFAHAPLRLSLTLHDLQRWDLGYQTYNIDAKEIKWVDMAFRHAIVSMEFIPTKNFYVALSYNHRRHQEMTMGSFKSLAGFGVGAGVKIYKFHVGFGMAQYQLGNYTYQFSITTALDEFKL